MPCSQQGLIPPYSTFCTGVTLLECVESKSGHPKVQAFQPFGGMFPASLMEKNRMQKPLSSSIFSSLFPLNLCLQHFPFFCYLPFTNVWQKLFFQEENLKACHEPWDPEGTLMGFSGKQNLS